MKNTLLGDRTEALPGPYAAPPETGEVQPSPATMGLVRSQVRALLESTPSYRSMTPGQRKEMAHNLVKIASYTAALVHDEWHQSKKLGQTPILKHEETLIQPLARGSAVPSVPSPPLAREAAASPSAEEFSPRAASQVAQITKQTLNAIAFPTFVADLIKGTFRAMVDASIQQMEAFGALLANVAKTVDQFMADNITDNQARDYLSQSFPGHFRVDASDDAPRVRVRDNADDRPMPDFRREFSLSEDFDDLDDDAVEEVLVPAAQRKLASNRHQLLSTMVLMGMNRIVITSGRISAKMGFRIDASDTGRASFASDFDFKNETEASYGGGIAGFISGGPSIKTKNTVAYVSSTKKESSDELNVEADLTGEVDLKFKSDYMPLSRWADPNMISLIQGNTPNPPANTPVSGGGGGGDGSGSSTTSGAGANQ